MPKEVPEGETKSTTGSMVADIKNNFGIDVGDIAGAVARDYVKGTILGQNKRSTVSRSKFGRVLDSLKDAWWVPAAVYMSLGISVIACKFLAKIVGVDV
jgi:hypothetical protein